MPTTNGRATTPEVAILARMLGNGDDGLPPEIARYVLTLRPSEQDKARMHELARRNQAGELSAEEQDELFAYTKAGTLMSILQSKARRVLGVKPVARPAS
jgi:demethoxyubiquinone hydroxylase (CLK1/Coq7/Cat5 family)